MNTLHREKSIDRLGLNEFNSSPFRLTQPLFRDRDSRNRQPGGLILIDEATSAMGRRRHDHRRALSGVAPPPMPMSQLGKRTAWLARVSSSRVVSLGLVAAIVLTDYLLPTQDLPFVPRALVDEPCHLLTGVIVLGTITRWRGRPPSTWFIWAMLSASVLIDVDHLPLEFGSYVLTAGTPRPYTHALWLVAVFAVAADIAHLRSRVPGRRTAAIVTGICAGAAWGLSAHFLRDVVTADIALWWPISSMGVLLPYGWYLVPLLLAAVLPLPRRAPAQPPRDV